MARSLFLLIALLYGMQGHAIETKKICMWDPVGNSGPVANFFADLKAKAIKWGLSLQFEIYTDEHQAAANFEAGNCDAAHITAIMSRKYVPFGGTLDAIGGIDSASALSKAMATIASPRAKDLMIHEDYELAAALPVGTMYVYVKNRKIRDIKDFKNKKVAILNDDPQAESFARLAEARSVPITLSNFADKFKNGEVDVLFMPALAYNIFELYQGLGEEGGIIDLPIYYGMLQTVIRRSAFPEDFGHNMRRYMLSRLKEMLRIIEEAEQQIPGKYWIPTTAETKDHLIDFSKEIRLALKVEGALDPGALRLLWKIRCKVNQNRPECVMP